MNRTAGATVVGAALVLFTMAGCGDNEPTTPEAPQTSLPGPHGDNDTAEAQDTVDEIPDSPAGQAVVTVQNFAFSTPATVRAGSEVTIDNRDGAEHSVTSDTAGAFDEDVDGNAAATFRAPTTPGTYRFHCKYHPEMVGTLVVQ
ncbi:cupredoxin domain-containing protein [Rhodococcus sp. NPDC003348]